MLILVTSEDHLRSDSPITTPSLQANDGKRKQTRHTEKLRLHVSEQPDPFILTIAYDILQLSRHLYFNHLIITNNLIEP
jgi:hypothetical protein